MSLDPASIRAIIFDFGNTLVQFDHEQVSRIDGEMIAFLERRCGPLDRDRFHAIREADRIAPYQNEFRENHLPTLFANHIRQLYGIEPEADLLDEMARVRLEAFLEAIQLPPYVHGLLAQLQAERHGGCKLAVLSNYPDGDTIRASLQRLGIRELFDAIVVSGDIGRVKPHPFAFETVLAGLNVTAESALHVGDNWLADIQGAKRCGLHACHLTQWETPERFSPADGDLQPDLVIEHLSQLPGSMLRASARVRLSRPTSQRGVRE